MRRPHHLTRNKGSEHPREVVVMDTETREIPLAGAQRGHVLVFGWAMYVRRHRNERWSAPEWKRFTTPVEFWSWCLRKVRGKARLTIYCHNAEFDAQVVAAFDELRRRKWKLITACLEGPPTIIKWRRGKRSVQWLDTLNLWRVSLKEIGAKVGLPKLDMPAGWSDAEESDRYCRRDVEIVWRALGEWWGFLTAHDLGNAAPTLAGQAFGSYRHRFMDYPIFIDANESALALSRAAYLGGRCECFRLGVIDEPGVTVDFNSMYPHVMREMQVPVRLLCHRTMATLPDVVRYLDKYLLCADVTINTPVPAFPHVIEGRLCFPIGRFRQSLATPELRLAIERGYVERVHSVAIYEGQPAFRRFMEWGWEQRRVAKATGDTMLLEQSKRLINAFYGKWGQRGLAWEIIGEAPDTAVRVLTSLDLKTGQWRRIRQLGRALQELRDKGESMNSHPAIAAHVTSEARMLLWRTMERVGLERVWYCDTDSLMLPERALEALEGLIDPEKLGALKIEARHAWIELRGCKDYRTPHKDIHKGVRASAESNDGVAYLQTAWSGWAGAIARGRLDLPVTEEVVKVLTREYVKGTPTDDGRVLPFRL